MTTSLPEVSPAQNELIFGRQPTIYVAIATMILNGAVLFTDWLTQNQATWAAAVVSAILGFFVVWKVAELAYPAFVALVGAGLQLVLGFGLTLTEEQQAWIGTTIPALVAVFLWPNVTPYVQTGRPVVAVPPTAPPAPNTLNPEKNN